MTYQIPRKIKWTSDTSNLIKVMCNELPMNCTVWQKHLKPCCGMPFYLYIEVLRKKIKTATAWQNLDTAPILCCKSPKYNILQNSTIKHYVCLNAICFSFSLSLSAMDNFSTLCNSGCLMFFPCHSVCLMLVSGQSVLIVCFLQCARRCDR